MLQTKIGFFALFTSSVLFGQFKMETASAMPDGLSPSVTSILNKDGAKIVGSDGSVYCEVWFRSTPPPSATTSEPGVTWTGVAHGSFLGVIHFPKQAEDRRGQAIKPGVYMLRFSYHPQNGDHLGVAPQRDFMVMSLASEDKDPTTTPQFDPLVAMSKKVSGTPHPAVLEMWKDDPSNFQPGFSQLGESDWVLRVKIGGTPIGVILIGRVMA